MFCNKWSENQIKNIIQNKKINDSAGPMTDRDIRNAFYSGEIYISPYNPKNLTPVGYNLCSSEIIISTKTGLPLKVYQEGKQKYVMVSANDTVLVATYESLFVGEQIMGTFHSRVRIVSQGFGHISTTLDPMWNGVLLVAINNPTNRKKKFVVYDNDAPAPFATLVFYRFNEPAVVRSFRPPNRTDILEEFLQKPKGIKKLLAGHSSSQYAKIVESLKCANNYTGEYTEHSILHKIDTCYSNILAEYKKYGYLQDLKWLSILEEYISKEEAIRDLPTFCVDMMEIVAYSIKKFDSRNKNRFRSSFDKDFCDIITKFILVCKKQLRYEQQSLEWKKTYNKCIVLSQENNFSSLWMRFTLGIPWREILTKLFWIILSAIMLCIITANPDLFKNSLGETWGLQFWILLLGIFSSLIVNIMGSFILRNKY